MSIDNIVDFEIVFMNCDSVMIDPDAVVTMSFEVESEKYEWDRMHRRIDIQRNLKFFKMSLDLNRSQLFRRRYITGMFGEGVDSRNADGLAAIERIKSSTDITAIYINGTKYSMPIKWKDDDGSDINLLQTTSVLTTTGGCYQLDINIIPESEHGKVCVY